MTDQSDQEFSKIDKLLRDLALNDLALIEKDSERFTRRKEKFQAKLMETRRETSANELVAQGPSSQVADENVPLAGRFALAADVSEEPDTGTETVRPLAHVEHPGAYWSDGLPKWDELGLRAELVLKEREVHVRWFKPQVQDNLDMDLWSIAAELLNDPEDRPQGPQGAFGSQGVKEALLMGSSRVEPVEIKLLAIHVFGPEGNHIGCVVMKPSFKS